MRSTIIVFLFFIFSLSTFPSTASKLYNRDGSLIAAPRFKISPKILSKLESVESKLCDSILKNVTYTPILIENNITLEAVLAIELNDAGAVISCKYVYALVGYFGPSSYDTICEKYEWVNNYYSNFFTKNLPGFTNSELKADIGQTEVIYIPLKFEMDKTGNCREISCGWLAKMFYNLVIDVKRH